jgi:hypothetical protein
MHPPDGGRTAVGRGVARAGLSGVPLGAGAGAGPPGTPSLARGEGEIARACARFCSFDLWSLIG